MKALVLSAAEGLVLAAALVLVPTRAFAAIETWPVDDGTTAALVEDHRAPIVTLHIVFPAGTWSPWVRRAHAQEAFTFQMRDTKAELRERAQSLATEVMLGMDFRSAGLQVTFLREDLDAIAALVRDVLANRDYDRRELIAKRRADKLSWGLADKDPRFRLGQAAAQRLFEPGDPRLWKWQRPEPVERDAAKLAGARDVLIRLPGRLVGFAGAISREDAERIARTLLPAVAQDIPADLAPRLGAVRPRAGADEQLRLARLTQVYFSWVRPSLPINDPDSPASAIANHVLGGHFYSRLYVALRHEGGETYGASWQSDGDVVSSTYALSTFTKAGNAKRTEEKLRAVLAEFHERGITEDERAAAGSFIVGRRAFARQSPGQILATWLRERALGLPEGWSDDYARRAASLPLDEINDFVRRWYDPAGFTMLEAVPEK